MYTGRVLTVLAFAARALSHGLHGVPRDEYSPLEVELSAPVSGSVSELVARIKNAGTADLNLLKVGTILDEKLPVQKLVVQDEAGESLQPTISKE